MSTAGKLSPSASHNNFEDRWALSDYRGLQEKSDGFGFLVKPCSQITGKSQTLVVQATRAPPKQSRCEEAHHPSVDSKRVLSNHTGASCGPVMATTERNAEDNSTALVTNVGEEPELLLARVEEY